MRFWLRLVFPVLMVSEGCSGMPFPANFNPATPPTSEPGIVGQITKIVPGATGPMPTLLVEANPQESSGSPKASVAFTADTHLFIQQGQAGFRQATLAELQVGQQVKVWFSGPVAESYPVQAKAGAILIVTP